MGKTKIDTRNLEGIEVKEISIEEFEVLGDSTCRFRSSADVSVGDTILVKALYTGPMPDDIGASGRRRKRDANVWRRGMVPFLTTVKTVEDDGHARARSRVVVHVQTVMSDDHHSFREHVSAGPRPEGTQYEYQGFFIRYRRRGACN
ncbi:MAG: hypothetical protein IT350_00680 [Deltaproteobacteria bacterium]|nr:hypothetical protein [Deltaproteobacteria bacterium]